MPTKQRNWIGILGVTLATLTFLGGIVKFTVFNRLEAAEVRISALERSQIEQDSKLESYMHVISMHLQSLDIGMSNIVTILETRKYAPQATRQNSW